MRARLGILLTLVSALLAGCGVLDGGPDCDRKGTGVGGIAGVFTWNPTPAYARVGVPTVYPFTYPIQQTCDDKVSARLERPDGTEPPFEASFQRSENTDGDLTLTVMEPGAFQLKLTFEPGTRVATLNILVVEDRSAAYEEIPRWCTRVQRTASGALLCDQRVFRQGVQVMERPTETRHAVTGNVVWEWDFSNGTLRRLVDEGSGALREEPLVPLGVPCCASPELLVSSESDVLAVATELRRYESTSTGLTSRGSATYGTSSGNSRYFIGESLLFRNYTLAFLVFRQLDRSEACVFSLEGGEVTPVPWTGPGSQQHNGCQVLAGTHVGVGDGGVWVYDTSKAPYQLRFYAQVGQGLVEAGSLELPREVEVGPAHGVNPGPPELRLGAERILPRFVNGRFTLDLYSPAPGYEFRDSSEGLVTFITSQGPGTTRIYRR
jgi:hypothetical protein